MLGRELKCINENPVESSGYSNYHTPDCTEIARVGFNSAFVKLISCSQDSFVLFRTAFTLFGSSGHETGHWKLWKYGASFIVSPNVHFPCLSPELLSGGFLKGESGKSAANALM